MNGIIPDTASISFITSKLENVDMGSAFIISKSKRNNQPKSAVKTGNWSRGSQTFK